MSSIELFPVLSRGCILRKLETPFVYNILDNQLYELDEEALHFLAKCSGEKTLMKKNSAFDYMLKEGIIQLHESVHPRKIKVAQSPIPSLRYLLLNITDKCNLACRHCYLGKSGNTDMVLSNFERAVSQFEEMGGLKLMLSGGEPLMHSGFWKLMEVLLSHELRIVLLSNGTLIGKKEAEKLSGYVHEVQISIDGIGSHDLMRGKGSYNKAMSGILNLRSFGVPVSIATMVHRYNIDEFDKMQKLFSEIGVVSWSVDVPCVVGNLEMNLDYTIPLPTAAKFLKYGFGDCAHESTGNFTCGSHLCAVSPPGRVSKCGFFDGEYVGDVNDLKAAWDDLCKRYLWTLEQLDCRNCGIIRDCRGGCRFRARQYKGISAPDPLLCYANGVTGFL